MTLGFALGTIPFGATVPADETFRLLDRFVEAGGRMLDTANNYPFWYEGCTGDESEATIGAWLAAHGTRDRVVIGTKVGARPSVAGDRTMGSAEGLAAPTIRAAIEGSLRRLGTDRVDVYWAHIEDRSVPVEETVEAFGELVKAGKVVELGASNLPAWRLERARATARASGLAAYTHLQLRHTHLRPRPGAVLAESAHVIATDEHLDYLRAEGDVTLWAYNSLMAGAYSRADRPMPETYRHIGTERRLAALHAVARELGATVNQVVLARLLADGVVPIVGVSNMRQLDEAIGATDVRLDAEAIARLDTPA